MSATLLSLEWLPSSLQEGVTLQSGAKKKGVLEGGFARMYTSLGCGALSANCTAGPNALGYFSIPSA